MQWYLEQESSRYLHLTWSLALPQWPVVCPDARPHGRIYEVLRRSIGSSRGHTKRRDVDSHCSRYVWYVLYSITVYTDWSSAKRKKLLLSSNTSSKIALPNVVLLQKGYLGCAPHNPTVAVSLRVLKVFHHTHLMCLQLSLQGQVRVLCHLHKVRHPSFHMTSHLQLQIPYSRYLTTQFSNTYDIYLAIQRRVQARINAALKHDTLNWRMLNACAPYLYNLKNEAPLKPTMQVAIDSNQSLKLVNNLFQFSETLPDQHDTHSSIWIKPDAKWGHLCRPSRFSLILPQWAGAKSSPYSDGKGNTWLNFNSGQHPRSIQTLWLVHIPQELSHALKPGVE